jgi:hypothetical protein
VDHGVNFYASKPSSLIGNRVKYHQRHFRKEFKKLQKKGKASKKIDKGTFPILGLPSPLKVEKIYELVFRN